MITGLLFSYSIMHFNPPTSLLKIVIEMIYIDVQTRIHSMQGFSLFKVVLLCDVTSNTMLFLLKSKGTAIYYISFQNQKNVRGSGRSQEFIKKPHFKNGSTKISVLEVRIDSMQHFFPFFVFGVTGFSLIRVRGRGRCI